MADPLGRRRVPGTVGADWQSAPTVPASDCPCRGGDADGGKRERGRLGDDHELGHLAIGDVTARVVGRRHRHHAHGRARQRRIVLSQRVVALAVVVRRRAAAVAEHIEGIGRRADLRHEVELAARAVAEESAEERVVVGEACDVEVDVHEVAAGEVAGERVVVGEPQDVVDARRGIAPRRAAGARQARRRTRSNRWG